MFTVRARFTTPMPTGPASGPTTSPAARRRPRPHPDAKNDGVGGIKFRPLTDDSKLPDEIIHRLRHQATRREARQAVLPRGRAAQAAHALERAEEVLRPVPARHDRTPAAYPKDDLKDVPPAGIKMAKPDGDHAEMLEVRPMEGGGAGHTWPRSRTATRRSAASSTPSTSRRTRRTRSSFSGATTAGTSARRSTGGSSPCGKRPRGCRSSGWCPGVTKPGGVCDRTVDLMSVYPTLCSLCGIAKPKHVEGEDIKPLLADPKARWDKPAITTFHLNNHAVRTEKWRYIRYAERRRGTLRPRRGRVRVDQPRKGREVRRREEDTREVLSGDEQTRAASRRGQGVTSPSPAPACRRDGHGILRKTLSPVPK